MIINHDDMIIVRVRWSYFSNDSHCLSRHGRDLRFRRCCCGKYRHRSSGGNQANSGFRRKRHSKNTQAFFATQNFEEKVVGISEVGLWDLTFVGRTLICQCFQPHIPTF